MLVKEIIKLSAEYLEMKNVIDYINGIDVDEAVLDDINNFVLAVNMVNNNIASSYIELNNITKINAVKNNIISFKNISENSIIEIKKITGCNGENIDFKIIPEGILVDKNCTCNICYSYFPKRVNFDDEINYYLSVNDITFAFGVVAEFLYIKGNIDDAYLWDKKFKNSIFNLIRPKRNIVLANKGW